MLSSPTVIPAHTNIEGRIETPGDLTIEGSCDGNIDVGGALNISKESTCRATIRARSCTIYGEVIGNVICSESIAVGTGARVVGDIRAPDVSIDPDAEIDGRVDVLPPGPGESEALRVPVRSRRHVGLTRPAPPGLDGAGADPAAQSPGPGAGAHGE